MKTLTEFHNAVLKTVGQLQGELTQAGKTAEEITAAIGEKFKAEGDKLKHLMTAFDAAKDKLAKLKRVVVIQPAEGAKLVRDAIEKEGLHFILEFFPEAAGPARGRDRDDRGGRGGRDGKKGGRDGKRGGPGGDRGGRGGERRDARPPRGDGPAPRTDGGKVVINPAAPRSEGGEARAPRPPREPRPPRAAAAPRAPEEPPKPFVPSGKPALIAPKSAAAPAAQTEAPKTE